MVKGLDLQQTVALLPGVGERSLEKPDGGTPVALLPGGEGEPVPDRGGEPLVAGVDRLFQGALPQPDRAWRIGEHEERDRSAGAQRRRAQLARSSWG